MQGIELQYKFYKFFVLLHSLIALFPSLKKDLLCFSSPGINALQHADNLLCHIISLVPCNWEKLYTRYFLCHVTKTVSATQLSALEKHP